VKTNYQLILDAELADITSSGRTPRLLLHSCCGPCSSYVLEYLSKYFGITVLYYNPNIWPKREYDLRADTQCALLGSAEYENPVDIIVSNYDYSDFLAAAAGLEDEPEGARRCIRCFELRLRETARIARDGGYDYFSTTLSVSPHKNAEVLNSIGRTMSEEYGVRYLYSDFKKRDGYKRSIYLSSQYGLYRQDYCGCEFSYRAASAHRDDRDANSAR